MRTDAQFLRVMVTHIGSSSDRARMLAIADALEGVLTPNPDRFPKVYRGLKINEGHRIKVDETWLTREELKTLRLYMQGLTPPEIAQRLSKAVKTVQTQLTSARARLQCANYAQLALKIAPLMKAEESTEIRGRGRSSNREESSQTATCESRPR